MGGISGLGHQLRQNSYLIYTAESDNINRFLLGKVALFSLKA
jgi:hypothetical protein